MLFHYESKQYASMSLQNYLTSLFDKQEPVYDYFLLSLQQLVRLLQMCKKLQLFIFWQLTHCHIIFPHAAKYHHIIIYAYSNCIKSPVYCLLLFPVLAPSTSPCYLPNILFFFRQHIVILHLLFLLSAPNRQTDLPNLLDLLDLTVLPTRRQTRVESCAVWEFLGEISRLAENCFGRSKWQFTIQTRKFTLSSSSQEQILPFSMM